MILKRTASNLPDSERFVQSVGIPVDEVGGRRNWTVERQRAKIELHPVMSRSDLDASEQQVGSQERLTFAIDRPFSMMRPNG